MQEQAHFYSEQGMLQNPLLIVWVANGSLLASWLIPFFISFFQQAPFPLGLTKAATQFPQFFIFKGLAITFSISFYCVLLLLFSHLHLLRHKEQRLTIHQKGMLLIPCYTWIAQVSLLTDGTDISWMWYNVAAITFHALLIVVTAIAGVRAWQVYEEHGVISLYSVGIKIGYPVLLSFLQVIRRWYGQDEGNGVLQVTWLMMSLVYIHTLGQDLHNMQLTYVYKQQ